MFKKIVIFIVVCVLIISCGASFAAVIDQSMFKTYNGSNEANWKLRSDGYHMGSKSFKYQLSTGATNANYKVPITRAISYWNSDSSNAYMNLTYNASSDAGRFTTTADTIEYKITRYHVSSENEVYEWTISLGEIMKGYVDGNYMLNYKIAIGQALGYVYGLDKINSSNCTGIMSAATHNEIQALDRRGLAVVTHHHNHMTGFTGSDYRTYASSEVNHRKVCTDCKGFILEHHTYGPIHAGLYTCTLCGFSTTTDPSLIF